MKKNILKLFLGLTIVIVGFVFAIQKEILAQFPTFEVYPAGSVSYPLVTNPSVKKAASTLSVVAKITDTSGVRSAIAKVREKNDATEKILFNGLMYDDGGHNDGLANDNIFGTLINITNIEGGLDSYVVDIYVQDNFLNAGTYKDVGNFLVSVKKCSQNTLDVSDGTEVCIQIASEALPDLSSWSYRKAFFIDNTNIDSTLTNFPLYVKIENDGEIGAHALLSGYDIRFTDAAGNLLPYERESWSGGGGVAVNASFWVKVPNLYKTPTGSQNFIFIYYGKTGAENVEDPANVWSSNYAGVWHMGSSTVLSKNDSTVNANNATLTTSAPSSASGKVNGSAYFNGSNYMSIPNNPSSLRITGSITLSAWVNAESDSSYRRIFDKAYNYGYVLSKSDDNYASMELSYTANLKSTTTIPGSWHYIVGTYNNYVQKIYIDGVLNKSQTISDTISDNSYNLTIGGNQSTSPNNDGWKGYIDEARVSNTARSADWIKFEYYNMNSNGSNLVLAIQESSPFSGSVQKETSTSLSISNSSVAAGEAVTLTAIATTSTGSAVKSNLITFTDETSGNTIGTAETDSSGIATILYTTSYGASSGVHTIKASLTESILYKVSSDTEVFSVQNDSNCDTVGETIICLAVNLENPPNATWPYRKPIAISGSNISSNLVDFPLYVKISADSEIGAHALSSGYDIIFTASDGMTVLPYERESWSGGGGTAATGSFWVKVPALTASTTNIIYVYYGKSGITTDPQDPANVWSSNYAGVWHMGSSTTLSKNDSTVNANNATLTTSALSSASGKVNGSAYFNGSNYMSIPNNPSSLRITGSITLSAWVNIAGKDSTWRRIFDKAYNNGYIMCITGDSPYGRGNFQVGNSQNSPNILTPSEIGSGWHYLNGVYNGSTEKIYIDGALVNTSSSYTGGIGDNLSNLTIGGNQSTNVNNEGWKGYIDEARVSNTARSADWIKFEYYNMNSSSNEITVGGHQTVSSEQQSTTMTLASVSALLGDTVALEATLKNSTGEVASFQTVTFTNQTTSTVIGTAVTNSSGIAVINTSAGGTYTINASFAENSLYKASQATATLTVSTLSDLWDYRKPITISKTNVSTSLASFPLLVKFTGNSDIGAHALSTGYDIRFTDASGNILPYERESWSGGGGTAATGIFWVKIPSISSSADTTIYIYYGKTDAYDGQNPSGVWDSNFKAVWHMGTASTLSATDSTTSTNNGTNSGVTATTGKINGAGSFNGSSSYIQISNPTPSNPSQISVSLWVKRPTSGSYLNIMFIDGAWEIQEGDCGTGEAYFWVQTPNGGTSIPRCDRNYLPSDNAWHYVVGTYDGSSTKLYVDNVLKSSLSQTGTVSGSTSSVSRIGSANSTRYFDGTIDEIRVSTTARSAGWIKFEYYNMNSSSNEITLGTQQSL